MSLDDFLACAMSAIIDFPLFLCSSGLPHPTVMWAQRPNLIFLTVCLSDCKDPQIKVEKDGLFFKGVGGTEKKMHAVDIKFLKEVDPEVNSNRRLWSHSWSP